MNERLSQKELSEKLDAAAKQIVAGTTYTHYKGDSYLVINLGIEEATNEVSVVYKALYGEQLIFIRTVASWMEMVEVDSTLLPRFAKV